MSQTQNIISLFKNNFLLIDKFCMN